MASEEDYAYRAQHFRRMAEEAAGFSEVTVSGKAMMEAIAREFLSIAELMDKLAAQAGGTGKT